MRLLRLDLLLFGHFEGTTLDLAAPKLHVVYGPNEAGKSTTRRAIRALLFGVPRGSSDAFAVGKAPLLRIGGLVADDRGKTLDFVRRGGQKDTLVDRAGEPIDDASLARLRGPLAESTFATVFSIDHTTLTEGASAILESGGDLAESLAVAALGTRELARTRAELEAREQRIFNLQPNASRTELHAAIRSLREDRARQESAESSPEAYAAQERALAEARTSHRAIVVETTEKRREADALDEALRARPVLEALANVRARLAALAPVPSLPPGLEVEHARAASEGRSARTRLRALETEREELAATALRRTGLLLEDALVERLADTERGLVALEARERKRNDIARARDATARRLERDRSALGTAANEARALVASRTTKVRLADDVALARKSLEAVERRAREVEAELEALPPPREDELAAALGPLEALASLDETSARAILAMEEARREHEAHTARAAALVATTFVGSPALERLVASPLPSRERLLEIAEELETTKQSRAKLVAESASASERLARVRERLAVEASTTPAVTADELRKARHVRDTYIGQLAVFPTRLEETIRVVAHADALADRMRHEVDRVLRHVELTEELRTRDARVAAIAIEIAAIDERVDTIGRAELAEARALGASLHDVAGLPAFRAKMDAVIDAERAVLESRLHRERAESTALALAAAYARGLALDGPVDLADLRARAVERRDALRGELLVERARGEGRKKLLAERKAQRDRERLEARTLEALEEELANVLAALVLPASAGPDDVRERLDALAEWIRTEDAVAELDAELAALAAEDAAFAEEIGLLAARAGIADDLRLGARAAALVARLGEASRARDAARRDAELVARNARESAALEVVVRETSSVVAEALAAANAKDDPSFAVVVRESQEKDALERRAVELEAELSRLLRRTARAEVEALLAASPADVLDARLAALEADLAVLDVDAKTALERAGRNEQGLEQFKNQDLGAARAAEDAELSFARVARLAEDWLAARAARRLLAARIERYRRESQGPVLERASRLFAALTLGAYAGITVELGEDPRPRGDDGSGLALHAVRERDGEGRRGAPLSVAELSTGTRDQLYFALRLASIERLADLGTRAPLVLDDALVHFDDDRARAAFVVLGELARSGTVVFLTHHARMAELAREALGDEGAVVHRLAR